MANIVYYFKVIFLALREKQYFPNFQNISRYNAYTYYIFLHCLYKLNTELYSSKNPK